MSGIDDGLPLLRLNSTQPLDPAWIRHLPARRQPKRLVDPKVPRLNGNSLLCRCPECGSPMSVRLWLRLADCWGCGACIELTDLPDQLNVPAQVSTVAEPAPTRAPADRGASPASDRPARRPDFHLPAPSPRFETLPKTSSRPPLEAPPKSAPVEPPPAPRSLHAHLSNWLNEIPAWLVSLLLHLAFLTLLGLLTLQRDTPLDRITLSTSVSTQVQIGGRMRDDATLDEPDYDLPVPEDRQPRNRRERAALMMAEQDARSIRLDPTFQDRHLPDLNQLRRSIGSDKRHHMLAVRDPRVRVELVTLEGGTTFTEAAVARGLRWMALHQEPDGRWSLDRFDRSPECDGRCDGRASLHTDSAATSLCLLPFLGAGQTHLSGGYRDTVAQGLRWLIENQSEDGDLRIDSRGNTGMYAHGQGAIVLCEALAMTGDEMLRRPAQKAIDFIVEAQHASGGWRYSPGEDGDTSVLGWQLMALQSARAAGLTVPAETLELAGYFLDSVQSRDKATYAYRPHQRSTHIMTAEALLCRMYLGWTLDDPGVREGLEWLIEEHLPSRREADFYYWYYATQAMHHFGGAAWNRWNLAMRDVLVDSQVQSGHAAGSWDPRGPHAHAGGRLYVTAMAVCTLEVYYRHAPIFRRIQLDGSPSAGTR